MDLLLGQALQKVAEGGQDGEPHTPAIAVAGPEQGGLADDPSPRHVRPEQAGGGFGDHEPEVVGHAVLEAIRRMVLGIQSRPLIFGEVEAPGVAAQPVAQ